MSKSSPPPSLPTPPAPEVLFERRESAKKMLGAFYEETISGLKVNIRELAREKGLSLELAYCELEAPKPPPLQFSPGAASWGER